MSIDDFAKILLVGALSFSIVGISIQIIRVLGSLNETMRYFPDLVKTLNKLADNINDDYRIASKNILKLTDSLGKISTDVLDPVITILNFLINFVAGYVKKFTGVDLIE